jgi:hypothetical protein
MSRMGNPFAGQESKIMGRYKLKWREDPRACIQPDCSVSSLTCAVRLRGCYDNTEIVIVGMFGE